MGNKLFSFLFFEVSVKKGIGKGRKEVIDRGFESKRVLSKVNSWLHGNHQISPTRK